MINENSLSAGHGDVEIKLWEYIDGQVSNDEKSIIEKLIRENAEWKEKYEALLEVHHSINFLELEQPSMRFTRNVMEEIAKHHIAPATKSYINNKVIWGIGIFFLTMIAGILIYGIAQVDWSAGSDSSSAFGIDLNKVDYSRMFDSTLMNIFMMMNVVLGLFFLDRFLSNRMRSKANHH